MNGTEQLPCQARLYPYTGNPTTNCHGEVVTVVTRRPGHALSGAYTVVFSDGSKRSDVWGTELYMLTPSEALAAGERLPEYLSLHTWWAQGGSVNHRDYWYLGPKGLWKLTITLVSKQAIYASLRLEGRRAAYYDPKLDGEGNYPPLVEAIRWADGQIITPLEKLASALGKHAHFTVPRLEKRS